MVWLALIILATLAVAALGISVFRAARVRGMNIWLPAYLGQSHRSPEPGKDIHVLLCIADHYEPGNGDVSREQAASRVAAWVNKYPALFSQFRDSDGKPPRHSFFYPIEMYVEQEVDEIARLCQQGFGEIEIHLHHHDDTAVNLRRQLESARRLFSERHRSLAVDRHTGEIKYGFIHGNWALDNSRRDGKCCGVNNELDVLRETGCYADFTLPSAPSDTQTRKINSIYRAVDNPTEPKSHNDGVDVGSGIVPANSLMLIQGPLMLDWTKRRLGVLPKVENACIQGNQAPTMDRLELWLKAGIQVPSRPDWFFVKLHTHGAPESNQQVLLGEPMVRFHRELAERASRDRHFHYHYVTAREMYNLVRAAECGGANLLVDDARDFELLWNGRTIIESVSAGVPDHVAAAVPA